MCSKVLGQRNAGLKDFEGAAPRYSLKQKAVSPDAAGDDLQKNAAYQGVHGTGGSCRA
jgi:hypothetical protein